MAVVRNGAIWLCFGLLAIPARLNAEEAKTGGDKPAPKKITYADDVQPIFREHCYTCHNQDEAKSDLALHSYGAVMKGGAGGEVVIPGDLDSSRLWHLVSHQESPKMPPEQDKLPDAKLNLIKQWILDGALENSGSKAKLAKKPNLELNASAGAQKPSGPPPMPEGLFREPFVTSPRAGAITALAASPWAPLVAIGGQKQILLYNTDSAELIGVLPFPEGTPQALKFSRSGTLLLCGGGRHGQSGKVVLYNVRTGQRVAELGDEVDAVLAADISPDHKLVAMGGPRRVVRVYSVEDGDLEYELRKHTDWAYGVEFSPNGKYLATSDRSGGVFIWEADTGREYQNLTGHTGAVTDLSWRVDSKLLATASEDGTVKVWQLDGGAPLKSMQAHTGGALAARFARNGQLVSAGRDKEVKLWDAGQGKQLRTFKGMAEQVQEVAFSYDDARIIGGDWLGDIRMWNTADAALIAQMVQNPPTLDALLRQQTDQLVAADTDAKKLTGEVEAQRKTVASVAAAAKQAADKLASTSADLKRLESELPQSEKKAKAAAEAAKASYDKVAKAKAALEKAKAARPKDGDPDEAKQKAETVVADAQQQLDTVRRAVDNAKAAFQTAEKQRSDQSAALKAAKQNLPALKAEAEKQAKAKTAADRALADHSAARDASVKKLATLQARIERTKSEKAAYEKSRTQQASAAK
ncbi:MAG TPA: c-type cytochrome domain-containing protein [Pirellulales bacterium]|nr:c-type cytochrome domain-containing protein [Pirellulales bacterium]